MWRLQTSLRKCYFLGRFGVSYCFMLACLAYIPVFEDNEGAVQLAKTVITNSNSKHIF